MRGALKSRVVSIINSVYERVLNEKPDTCGAAIEENTARPAEILLLQYGSAFFEADDTEESDFDILMVAKYEDLENFMEQSGYRGSFEASEVRSRFFFGRFYDDIASENEVEAYAADHARIPQIKLIIENYLHVDISFAVVSNTEFSRVVLGDSVVS